LNDSVAARGILKVDLRRANSVVLLLFLSLSLSLSLSLFSLIKCPIGVEFKTIKGYGKYCSSQRLEIFAPIPSRGFKN